MSVSTFRCANFVSTVVLVFLLVETTTPKCVGTSSGSPSWWVIAKFPDDLGQTRYLDSASADFTEFGSTPAYQIDALKDTMKFLLNQTQYSIIKIGDSVGVIIATETNGDGFMLVYSIDVNQFPPRDKTGQLIDPYDPSWRFLAAGEFMCMNIESANDVSSIVAVASVVAKKLPCAQAPFYCVYNTTFGVTAGLTARALSRNANNLYVSCYADNKLEDGSFEIAYENRPQLSLKFNSQGLQGLFAIISPNSNTIICFGRYVIVGQMNSFAVCWDSAKLHAKAVSAKKYEWSCAGVVLRPIPQISTSPIKNPKLIVTTQDATPLEIQEVLQEIELAALEEMLEESADIGDSGEDPVSGPIDEESEESKPINLKFFGDSVQLIQGEEAAMYVWNLNSELVPKAYEYFKSASSYTETFKILVPQATSTRFPHIVTSGEIFTTKEYLSTELYWNQPLLVAWNAMVRWRLDQIEDECRQSLPVGKENWTSRDLKGLIDALAERTCLECTSLSDEYTILTEGKLEQDNSTKCVKESASEGEGSEEDTFRKSYEWAEEPNCEAAEGPEIVSTTPTPSPKATGSPTPTPSPSPSATPAPVPKSNDTHICCEIVEEVPWFGDATSESDSKESEKPAASNSTAPTYECFLRPGESEDNSTNASPTPSPSPTPTPSPSPTPTPTPSPSPSPEPEQKNETELFLSVEEVGGTFFLYGGGDNGIPIGEGWSMNEAGGPDKLTFWCNLIPELVKQLAVSLDLFAEENHIADWKKNNENKTMTAEEATEQFSTIAKEYLKKFKELKNNPFPIYAEETVDIPHVVPNPPTNETEASNDKKDEQESEPDAKASDTESEKHLDIKKGLQLEVPEPQDTPEDLPKCPKPGEAQKNDTKTEEPAPENSKTESNTSTIHDWTTKAMTLKFEDDIIGLFLTEDASAQDAIDAITPEPEKEEPLPEAPPGVPKLLFQIKEKQKRAKAKREEDEAKKTEIKEFGPRLKFVMMSGKYDPDPKWDKFFAFANTSIFIFGSANNTGEKRSPSFQTLQRILQAKRELNSNASSPLLKCPNLLISDDPLYFYFATNTLYDEKGCNIMPQLITGCPPFDAVRKIKGTGGGWMCDSENAMKFCQWAPTCRKYFIGYLNYVKPAAGDSQQHPDLGHLGDLKALSLVLDGKSFRTDMKYDSGGYDCNVMRLNGAPKWSLSRNCKSLGKLEKHAEEMKKIGCSAWPKVDYNVKDCSAVSAPTPAPAPSRSPSPSPTASPSAEGDTVKDEAASLQNEHVNPTPQPSPTPTMSGEKLVTMAKASSLRRKTSRSHKRSLK